MKVSELEGVMTKDELLEKVRAYEESVPVEAKLGSQIQFEVTPESKVVMDCRENQVVLSHVALDQMLMYIGFPRTYLKKVPKEQYSSLVLPHLDYWYRDALAGNLIRLFVLNNQAIAVAPKADFQHISISEIVKAAEAQLGDLVAGYHKFHESRGNFVFSILMPKEVDLGEGDLFNQGIQVEHNLVGESSTKVSAYLFRQWCSNGATTEDQISSWRRRSKSGEPFDVWFQKSIMAANKVFDEEIMRVRALKEVSTNEHTADILNSVLEHSSVPQGLQKEVRSILIDRDAETLYDIYNVLTEVDTHSNYFEEKPSSTGLLNKVAAHLARCSELCPTCHRQMRN